MKSVHEAMAAFRKGSPTADKAATLTARKGALGAVTTPGANVTKRIARVDKKIGALPKPSSGGITPPAPVPPISSTVNSSTTALAKGRTGGKPLPPTKM